MIQFRLAELLADRGWSVYRLSKESGIRQDVIATYRNNTVKRAVLAHVSEMCAALECDIGELMEFVPDKVPAKTSARKKR